MRAKGPGISFFVVLSCVLIFTIGSVPGEKIKLATISRVPYYELPALALEENRIWAKHGLAVEFTPTRSARELDTGLLMEAFHSAIVFASGHFIRLSLGVPTVMVADLGGLVEWYLWVRPGGRVNTLEDLEGGKIGVLRLGSTSHAYGKVFAKGLQLRSLKVIATGGIRESVAALRVGVVEAIPMSLFVMARLEVEGAVRKVAALTDYLPTKEWDPTVLVITPGLLNRDPRTAARIVQTVLEGATFVTENREWTIGKLMNEYGHPRSVAERLQKLIVYSKDGKIYRHRLEKLGDFLVEHGLAEARKISPLEVVYSRAYVPIE